MAGEFMVVGNPRRRKTARRRTRRAKASHPRRRRRARVVHHNPARRVRRRRSSARRVSARRGRRRVHRNPRMAVAGLNLNSILTGVAGAALADIGAGFISKHLPAQWQSGASSYAVKAAVGIGGPMLLKKFRIIPANTANALAAGAALVVAFEAYLEFIKPHLPLGEYVPGNMGEYSLSGPTDVTVNDNAVSMYGGSMY